MDGAKTRCIFCNGFVEATPAAVMRHVMQECNSHPVRDLERVAGDLIKLLVDRRVQDGDKLTIVIENGMVRLASAEEHLGVALERLRYERVTATEVVMGLKDVVLCKRLLGMLHPAGRMEEAPDGGASSGAKGVCAGGCADECDTNIPKNG